MNSTWNYRATLTRETWKFEKWIRQSAENRDRQAYLWCAFFCKWWTSHTTVNLRVFLWSSFRPSYSISELEIMFNSENEPNDDKILSFKQRNHVWTSMRDDCKFHWVGARRNLKARLSKHHRLLQRGLKPGNPLGIRVSFWGIRDTDKVDKSGGFALDITSIRQNYSGWASSNSSRSSNVENDAIEAPQAQKQRKNGNRN